MQPKYNSPVWRDLRATVGAPHLGHGGPFSFQNAGLIIGFLASIADIISNLVTYQNQADCRIANWLHHYLLVCSCSSAGACPVDRAAGRQAFQDHDGFFDLSAAPAQFRQHRDDQHVFSSGGGPYSVGYDMKFPCGFVTSGLTHTFGTGLGESGPTLL